MTPERHTDRSTGLLPRGEHGEAPLAIQESPSEAGPDPEKSLSTGAAPTRPVPGR